MAWRVFFGVSLTGMVCTLIIALTSAGDGARSVMGSLLPYVFAVVFPVMCSLIASVAGPWLTRFFPFSQSLLFGGLGVTAVAVLSTIISVWEWAARGPCPSDTLCGGPLDGMLWIVMLFGLPAFLSACIGFGFSIWSPTRRGRKVFWLLWGVVLSVFAAVLLHAVVS